MNHSVSSQTHGAPNVGEPSEVLISPAQLDPDFRIKLEQNAPERGARNCPHCNGLGYLFDPLGAGRSLGAFILCGCRKEVCRCNAEPPYQFYDASTNAMAACPARDAHMTADRIALLHKHSGIPSRYAWKFMSSILYDSIEGDGSILMAIDAAITTIEDYGRKHIQGLYFYGGTGCGKTLISCAILNELMRLYQVPVKYAKISRDILGRLRATFNPNSESFGEGRRIEQRLADIPVLVIDDFGVHRESQWVNEVLYDLIDARYENDRLTIITSNESMGSWSEHNRRIYSRLRQMCLEIHIEAPDFRDVNARGSISR